MRLSVVIFAEDYIPNIGGIAVHVHNLSVSLVKAGCRVEVISTVKHLPRYNIFRWRKQRKNIDGVDVLEIPMLYSPKNLLYHFQVRFRFARIVRKELKKREATIFHWHNIHFDPEVAHFIHKDAKKIGMIFTNHSSQFLQGMMNAEQLSYNVKNLNYADYIITPSTELKIETEKCGIDSNKVIFISNGVNTDYFSPNEKQRQQYRNELGLKEEIAVICPRRIVPKCGVVYLAKALLHLKTDREVVFYFTGLDGGDMTWRDVAYEDEVKSYLKGFKSNVRVVALPQIANAEMLNYYRAMDICVLPSLMEATSISGLEAMSVQLALIGTNVGGIPELITNNLNGLLVNKEDEVALANALDKIIDDKQLLASLALNARKTVLERFDWSIIAKEVLKIYNKTQV